MILRPRSCHLLVSLYLCISLISAWPWPPSLPQLHDLLIRRQDDKSESSKPSAAATDSQPSKTSATAVTTGKLAAATTGKSSESGTKTTGKGAAKTTDKEPQDTDVDPRLPPGGVNMITPSALATSTYYKIGVDSVSLVWNYTSLSVSPSKIDILVTCTANQATYTLASNQSYEETGSVVWDTKAEETGQNPLLTEKYTLIIHDAEKAVTDRPDSGHLGSYNQFVFGMYVPQPYTPRAQWKCPTCNDALSDTERQALKFMATMCGITIFSFTWFVGGFAAMF